MKIRCEIVRSAKSKGISYNEMLKTDGIYALTDEGDYTYFRIVVSKGVALYVEDDMLDPLSKSAWKNNKFEKLHEDIEIKFIPA